MTGRIPARAAKLAGAILAATAVSAVAVGTASATVVYNSTPKTLPGNFRSLGFEATQTSEFGGAVGFTSIQRKSPAVTVVMSSWACEKGRWTWPESGTLCLTKTGAKFKQKVTLNVYEAVGAESTVGNLVASKEQEFEMPYRPSASSKCTGEAAGAWYQGSTGECFHGKAFKIKFTLPGVNLPAEKAIISVAYNTSDYGAAPQRPQPCNEDKSAEAPGCPYDSLNVAVHEKGESEQLLVGTDPAPTDAYINSTTAGNYCENPGGVGTFAKSKNCWTEEQPVIQVVAAK